MMRVLLASAGLALAACGEEPARVEVEEAPPPPAETVVSETADLPRAGLARAEIDWSAARTDLAASPPMSRSVDGSDAAFQVQSGGDAPPVPVLLPTGIVSVQRAGASPSFRQQEDGYFARYPGVAYDITVHGTNVIADVPGMEIKRDETVSFAAMMDGAQVSLSRYGADYLVTFECRAAGGGETCVSEDEALEVARGLVIVGTR